MLTGGGNGKFKVLTVSEDKLSDSSNHLSRQSEATMSESSVKFVFVDSLGAFPSPIILHTIYLQRYHCLITSTLPSLSEKPPVKAKRAVAQGFEALLPYFEFFNSNDQRPWAKVRSSFGAIEEEGFVPI